MRSEDLKRIFELKNDKENLSKFIDDLAAQQKDWEQTLLAVIAASPSDLIEILFEIALKNIQFNSKADQWHNLLCILTAYGFRASYKDKVSYPKWLSNLLSHIDTLCTIKYKNVDPKYPNPKSIIVCYCLFHYLEAFTTVTEITKSEEAPELEVRLLKQITDSDESLLLFPFCYVVWDHINIFVGPQPSSLTIPHLIQVIKSVMCR